MSRKAPVFAIFCLITAALSLVYLIVYHLWLQPQAYEINGYSLLYDLLCRQLLSFSVVGGTVSFFTNFFLKTIPAPVRMLLLIVPIFFLLMYAFGCLFLITGFPLRCLCCCTPSPISDGSPRQAHCSVWGLHDKNFVALKTGAV